MSFNSKVVRLKGSFAAIVAFQTQKFQFQSGAVKSRIADLEKQVNEQVSIPKWCG